MCSIFLAVDIKLVVYSILNNELVTLVVLRIAATAFSFVSLSAWFNAQAISVTEIGSDQGQSNIKVTWLLGEDYHNWASGYSE